MSDPYYTILLSIDHGKRPDWDAAAQLIEDLAIPEELQAEYEGFPSEDGTPAEQGRQELRDNLQTIRAAWNNGDGGWNYEIRRVRDIDLHILYDDIHDPVELHHAEGNLETYAPEVFTIAGFDPASENGES